MSWRSRIVGHDRVDPRTIRLNAANPREHSSRQREVLTGAITDVGFVRSVTVNRQTGNLVDGQMRVEEAIRSGEALVDVEYIDVTLDEERAILAMLDPIGALATPNDRKLAELLGEIETGSGAVLDFLDDLGRDLKNRHAADFLDPFLSTGSASHEQPTTDGASSTSSSSAPPLAASSAGDAASERGASDFSPGPSPASSSTSEQYTQLAFPLTVEQRKVIIAATTMACERWGLRTSVEGIVAICNQFLTERQA